MKNPDVSLVMPCYNEEVAIKETAPKLISVFKQDGIDIELVLVNNGSIDKTGEVIDDLIRRGYPIRKVDLKKNQGYGGGILEGLNQCRAPIIGYLCADGQVSAEDALMAFRLIKGRENRTITKIRRRFRQDSWKRKTVSIFYNGLMQILFGGLGAIDINGSPKIFSRKNYGAMELASKDWFLDPEIIIKAKYLDLRTIEVDVEGHRRKGGTSNVNLATCFEFVKNILGYRIGNGLNEWKQKINGVKISEVEQHLPLPNVMDIQSSIHRCDTKSSPFNGIRILTQKRHEDSRGFVQKILSASQCNGNPPRGEVYVTSAKLGEAKGNHYHINMGEWFSVVQGEGEIRICDPKSMEQNSIRLGASIPQTVYVPAGVAHSILNNGKELLICVAWAEKEHDPKDVYPFRF